MTIPDKALKILSLALNDAAAEGEWNAAAIKFVSCLRANAIGIEVFTTQQPPTQAKPPRNVKMPFGKYKGELIRAVPTDYLQYLLSWDKLKDDLREIIAAEVAYRAS